jgi:acyl-CoA synthetase (AMP-forming)/AMP-acid ligase II
MAAPKAEPWRTVPTLVAACAEHRPDVTLLADADGRAVTGSELLDLTLRGAEHLRRRGVERGRLVAIEAGSTGWVDVALTYLSVTWLGAVAVLVMNPQAEQEARERLGAVLLVTTGDSSGNEVASPAELQGERLVTLPAAAVPEDRLDVVYTSGSTGSPKPVLSTHGQWATAVRPEMLASRTRRTVAHSGIPIGVSGGLHGIFLTHLGRGVTSLWGKTAPDLVQACRTSEVGELHLTPHVARFLDRLMAPVEPWAEQVKIVRIVGGPVPQPLATALAARFPKGRVVSFYGLTEGGTAQTAKVMDGRRRGSIGRPLPGTEVRVVDGQGRDLPAGEVGEILMRTVGSEALSYYQEESLTRDWFPDGWTRTGDLGFVAPDGEVRLVGRSKEMIVLRGGRVPPEALEEVLSRAVPPDVEFAVAGVSTDGSWDRIAVFLQGAPDSREVEAARRELEAVKGPFRPQVIHVVEEIPRSANGKPLRRALVEGLPAER